MQQLKTIKIFLASSITELREERVILSDNISGNISNLLEKENSFVHFIKCDNDHAGNDGTREQDYYNQLLRDCEYSVFLFKTHLGDRTEEEYAVARELQKTQRHVIFTYFLNVPEEMMEQRLIDFRGNLKNDWEVCNNIDDVEKRLMLGLLKRLGVKIDTSKSDRIEQTGENLFKLYQNSQNQQKEIRDRLHQFIEGILIQIESVMSSDSESIAGRIVQAKALYSKANHWAGASEYEKIKYLDLLSDYSDFILRYGLYGGAEAVFLQYIKLFKELQGSKNLEFAMACSKIGALYDCMKNYKLSLNYHKAALKIRIKMLGRNHLVTADSFIHLAIVYSELNRNMAAIWYFNKALHVRKKILGKDNPLLACDYNNLGWLFCIQNMFYLAQLYLHKAMDVVDVTDKVVTPYLYNNIGFVYMFTNHEKEALNYLKKAIEIRERELGPKHPDTVESYINIGYLFEKMNNKDKSIEYYNKALSIPHKNIKPIHHAIRRSYNWNKVSYALTQKGAFSYLQSNWKWF